MKLAIRSAEKQGLHGNAGKQTPCGSDPVPNHVERDMQPNAHALQRKPHDPVPKPRRSVTTRGRQVGRTDMARSQARAEGELIRLVARLAADTCGNADRRTAHGYFINGYLLALETHHLVPANRLMTIRQTCDVLLDGDITMQDLRAMKTTGSDTDPTYLRAVSAVNRARVADAGKLASDLNISEIGARRLIERMQADGLVNQPDMFGVCTLASVEVAHV